MSKHPFHHNRGTDRDRRDQSRDNSRDSERRPRDDYDSGKRRPSLDQGWGNSSISTSSTTDAGGWGTGGGSWAEGEPTSGHVDPPLILNTGDTTTSCDLRDSKSKGQIRDTRGASPMTPPSASARSPLPHNVSSSRDTKQPPDAHTADIPRRNSFPAVTLQPAPSQSRAYTADMPPPPPRTTMSVAQAPPPPPDNLTPHSPMSSLASISPNSPMIVDSPMLPSTRELARDGGLKRKPTNLSEWNTASDYLTEAVTATIEYRSARQDLEDVAKLNDRYTRSGTRAKEIIDKATKHKEERTKLAKSKRQKALENLNSMWSLSALPVPPPAAISSSSSAAPVKKSPEPSASQWKAVTEPAAPDIAAQFKADVNKRLQSHEEESTKKLDHVQAQITDLISAMHSLATSTKSLATSASTIIAPAPAAAPETSTTSTSTNPTPAPVPAPAPPPSNPSPDRRATPDSLFSITTQTELEQHYHTLIDEVQDIRSLYSDLWEEMRDAVSRAVNEALNAHGLAAPASTDVQMLDATQGTVTVTAGGSGSETPVPQAVGPPLPSGFLRDFGIMGQHVQSVTNTCLGLFQENVALKQQAVKMQNQIDQMETTQTTMQKNISGIQSLVQKHFTSAPPASASRRSSITNNEDLMQSLEPMLLRSMARCDEQARELDKALEDRFDKKMAPCLLVMGKLAQLVSHNLGRPAVLPQE